MTDEEIKVSKNSLNKRELSVRERMELDKEIRRISVKIRKEHPLDWREILKSTNVYKKRHNLPNSENQNDETEISSKSVMTNNIKNKNKSKQDKNSNTPTKASKNIIKSDISKQVSFKKQIEKNNNDELKTDSTTEEVNGLYDIKNELRKNSGLINSFYSEIISDGFLSFEKREKIAVKYSHVYKVVSKVNKFSDSHKQNIFSEFDNLKRFLKVYKDLINYTNLSDSSEDNEIRKINEDALDSEINENGNFFKDIDDIHKKRAIVIDEKNVRVNAGAGTGKTFTIQNKVRYLIEKKGISPKKILCLSYTVKGAEDLEDKVNQNLSKRDEVKTYTFHGFCRKVARDCGEHRSTDRDILKTAVLNYFKNFSDDEKLNKLIEYFGYYINSPANNEDYSTYKELLAYENGKDLNTLKNKFYGSGVTTLTMQGEIVKSIGELMIANYLFMHKIEYEYESKYQSNLLEIIQNHFLYSGNYSSLINLESKGDWINNFIDKYGPWYLYRPDFYLPKYDIYLEHFGTTGNRKKDEKWLGKDYIDQMDRKRKFHKEHQTKLLETKYSYLVEGRLFEELEKLLENNGVEIGQMNRQDSLDILNNINKIEDFENFNNLLISFINIFEAQNNQKEQFIKFKKMNKLENDGYKRKRQELFLDIVSDIYDNYFELNEGENIDNNREVSLALELIQTKRYSDSFDYILIDEYQDINPVRSLLLQSLQKITDAKLFVVGDDWQSIYRFNGSDLNLFLDFEDYFHNSELIKLEENRRNYDVLNDIASRFIMENKKQEQKQLKSIHKWNYDSNPIKIINYPPKPNEKKVFQLYSIITEIINSNPKKEKTRILLLSRNNKDIVEFTGNSLFKIDHMKNRVRVICLKNLQLDITFMSIHKSKGLEYDEVVVLNFKDYLSGFPNKIEDDSILHFLKDKEEYPYAEERRLLYVAMTRTRNNVYLLSPNYDKSVFIRDLVNDFDIKPMELEVDERIENNYTSFEKSNDELETIKMMLNKASEYKSSKQYLKALKIFEDYYKKYPDYFKYNHKEDYAWVIYWVYVDNYKNEKVLFNAAKLILKITEQVNSRNRNSSCVYTSTVFKVLDYLNFNDFPLMLSWLGRINPKYLNPFPKPKRSGMLKSKKELFYEYLSNAHYMCGDYKKCIEVCVDAYCAIDEFVDDSYMFKRVMESIKRLNDDAERIFYLKKLVRVHPDWRIYMELAKCCYNLKKPSLEPLKYVCPVIFDKVSNTTKKEIYFLIYKILIDSNKEEAINHLKFYYLLKMETGGNLPHEITEYDFEKSQLDKNQLESSIMAIWEKYRKSQQKLY